MRFSTFTLARYGHFADHSLELPAPQLGAADLHIIIGPNEAGKSTLRAGLVEFLFGMEQRTPFNFRYDYKDLLLSAVIEVDGEVEHLQRRKAQRGTLRDSQNNIVADGHLAALLNGLDRESYVRQFALDQETLVAGGQNLLSNRSNLSTLMFEAASGISDVAAHQQMLEGQAASLWRRARPGNTQFGAAAKLIQEADRNKRAAITNAPAYAKLQRDLRQAEAARDAARALFDTLQTENTALERLRRTAPNVARLNDLDQQLGALNTAHPNAPRLAVDAPSRFLQAREKTALLDADLCRHNESHARLLARSRDLDVDENILNATSRIEALVAESARIADFPRELSRRQGEISANEQRACAVARHIGWSEATDRGNVSHQLPALISRQQLVALTATRSELTNRVDTCTNTLATITDELNKLDAEVAELQSIDVAETLSGALSAARQLGEIEERTTEFNDAAVNAKRLLDNILSELSPWDRGLNDLQTLTIVSLAELDEHTALAQRAKQVLEKHSARTRELRVQVSALNTELDTRRAQRKIVDLQLLEIARSERDRLWSSLREGESNLANVAKQYEQFVVAADSLADERFISAETIARVEQLEVDRAKAEAELRETTNSMHAAGDDLEQLHSNWAQSMLALTLEGMTPARYRNWLGQRQQALEAKQRWQAAVAAQSSFAQRLVTVTANLRSALDASTSTHTTRDSANVSNAISAAEQLMREADRRTTEHAQKLEQRTEVLRRRTASERQYGIVQDAWHEWQSAWQVNVNACKLPATISVSAATDALERMAEIEQSLAQIELIENEFTTVMARDIDLHTDNAHACAQQLDPSIAALPAAAIVATLHARLRHSLTAASSRDELKQQLDEAGEHIAMTTDALRSVRAQTASLFADAGLANDADFDSLRSVVELSAEFDQLEDERRTKLNATIEAADGTSLESLRGALAASDPDQRTARMQALIEDELPEARARLEQCSVEHNDKRRELESIVGADLNTSAAAQAEEDRQHAIAKVTDISTEYFDVSLRSRVLRWAVERYKQENQSPLLARAQQIFAQLTQDRYVGLLVDIDHAQPELSVRLASGKEIQLTGLSVGTRDQLFLALRLAAVELQISQSKALPFIADDLFVNFDEGRTTAGFKALAHLARHTQVFYLSHHAHVVDLANNAVAGELNIVTLDPSAH